MNPLLVCVTTCWLVVSGTPSGSLAFEGPAPPGLQDGVLSELARDGRVLGKLVRHGARVHGVLTDGAKTGAVEVRATAAAIGPMPCDLSAAHARVADMRVHRNGHMEWGSLRMEPIPACGGEDALRIAHGCPIEVSLLGGGLALEGALALQWNLQRDLSGSLHFAVRAEALRAVVLEDGLGMRFEGAAFPFPASAEQLTRGEKGWRAASGGAVHDAWPLDIGCGFLAPTSPWQLWFEHALRQEDGRFELLVLPRGARLEAGESRIFRTRLLATASGPEVQAMLLAAEPPVPASPFERLVRDQVQRFLGDERHGLRRREPDAGDWMHQDNAVGNLEYDTIGGLLAHATKWGDAPAAAAARAAREHLLSVDLAPSRGFPFEHGPGHRSGRHEAGHHWMWGLLESRRVHPDPMLDPVLQRLLVAQECEFENFDPQRELERSTGWGMLALAESARAAVLGKRGQRALGRLARSFISRPWNAGWFAPAQLPASERTLVLESFEQGIHLLALNALAASGTSDAARGRAERLAACLERDALRPDDEGRLQVAESIAVERGTGRTIHVTGLLRPAKALLMLAALGQVRGTRGSGRISAAETSAVARFPAEARTFTGEETALLLFAERLRDARQLNRRGG